MKIEKIFPFLIFILIAFNASFSYSAILATTPQEQDFRRNIDEISISCLAQKKRDTICESLVIIKQIGNDSVEFLKEYLNLTPLGYAALTTLNYAATGRLRFRTDSFLFKRTQHIYDYHRDKQEMWFIIDRSY